MRIEEGSLDPEEPLNGAVDQSRFDELVRTIAVELVSTAQPDWYRIDLRVWATAGTTQYEVTVIETDGTSKTLTAPMFSLVTALRDLRDLMYETNRGTWFSLRYTIDRPAEYRVLLNYENDPNWWPEIATDDWLADLSMYPRDPEYIPDWLRAKLTRNSQESSVENPQDESDHDSK